VPASAAAQTSAPETVNIHGPDSPASDPTPTFEFSSPDPDATFECRLGTGPWTPCHNPSVQGPLADGAYHFEVRATKNGVADPTPVAYDIVIDTAVPDTAVSDPDSTTTATPTFTLTSDKPDTTFECELDNGTFTPCASPYTTPALALGKHELEVRASDQLNHTDGSPALVQWTVRRPPPVPTPTPEPTPTPVATPSRDLSGLRGSLVAPDRCQDLPDGDRTDGFTVPKIGRVRVRIESPDVAGGPVVVTLHGQRFADVSYGVDGLPFTAGTTPPFRLTLSPAELSGETDHELILRVRVPHGLPRTVTTSFTSTPCDARLTIDGSRLRIDSRRAMSEVSFDGDGVRLDGGVIDVSAFGRQDSRFGLGRLGGERDGIHVSRVRGRIVVRGLPPDTGIVRLDLPRTSDLRGRAPQIVAGGKALRL
jgi:hypothetical protein